MAHIKITDEDLLLKDIPAKERAKMTPLIKWAYTREKHLENVMKLSNPVEIQQAILQTLVKILYELKKS